MNDIIAYLNTLTLSVDAREDLRVKLEDIQKRGVQPHLVESYCKSLGWAENVWTTYANYLAWDPVAEDEEVQEADLSNNAAEAAVRTLLNRFTMEVFGQQIPPDVPLIQVYRDLVNEYKLRATEIVELESQLENAPKESVEDAVSLAVNNLMVGFLRKAGYADSDISEMSLAEMSSRIENSMAVVNAITAVAMDKEGVY